MSTVRLTADTFGPTVRDSDIVFAKVDTEAEQMRARQAGITSVPTLMAFRDGVLICSEPGALPTASLEEVITAVRTLDMNDVRTRIAERETVA